LSLIFGKVCCQRDNTKAVGWFYGLESERGGGVILSSILDYNAKGIFGGSERPSNEGDPFAIGGDGIVAEASAVFYPCLVGGIGFDFVDDQAAFSSAEWGGIEGGNLWHFWLEF